MVIGPDSTTGKELEQRAPGTVELLVPARTLLKLAVAGALAVLTIVALDVLLSSSCWSG